MRTFLTMYSMYGKSLSSEQKAFTLLASVCSNWHLCLTGWPQSPTRHWMRHQLKKVIERENTHTHKAHTFVSTPLRIYRVAHKKRPKLWNDAVLLIDRIQTKGNNIFKEQS